jgi:hypothetical protein
LLWKLTDSKLGRKTTVLSFAAMKGSGRSVELIVAVDEASRMTGGGGNSCGVASPVLWPPYIRSRWCEAAHWRMASADDDRASM